MEATSSIIASSIVELLCRFCLYNWAIFWAIFCVIAFPGLRSICLNNNGLSFFVFIGCVASSPNGLSFSFFSFLEIIFLCFWFCQNNLFSVQVGALIWLVFFAVTTMFFYHLKNK